MNGKGNPEWLTSQQNMRAVQTSVVVSTRKVPAQVLPVPGVTYRHSTIRTVTAYVNAAYDGLVWFTRRNSASGVKWHGKLTTADFTGAYDMEDAFTTRIHSLRSES